MNAERRKELSKIEDRWNKLKEEAASIKEAIEQVRDAEQEAYDNATEGYRNGEKGERSQQYVSDMDEAMQALEAIDEFDFNTLTGE